MSTAIYVAIARVEPTGGYRANFPDLPDCSAIGANPGELLAHAREAVSAKLQALADDGDEWPPATPIELVRPEPGAALLLVDVEVEDTPVRVNISLGEQLLKRLDAAAEARGATRSGFIAQAVRASLGEKSRFAGPEIEGAARRVQDELAAVGRKINESFGPDSAFSRSMAEFDDKMTETIRKAADSVSAAMARRRDHEAASARAKADSVNAD